MSNKQKHFPKDFFWGASTASHQVEGGTINDWTVWELAHASELAKNSKQLLKMRNGHLPITWDEVKDQAADPSNYVSGRGVEHYTRYKEDLDIAQNLNLNAFRFCIEWSRIEPSEGQWDQEAIEHYREYIFELKKRGLEPFLNILHYTMPTWFADQGGFRKKANLVHWRRFVQKVSDEYGKEVRYVITINEPNVYVSFAYLLGWYPPQIKNLLSCLIVYWHLVLAHRQAFKILKSSNPHLKIGIASQLANIQAKRPHNIIDETVTKLMRYFWNWWFLHRIRKTQDFVGFNYYFTDYYKHFKRVNPTVPTNDLGWYMEPEGLYPILLRVWARYKKPIIITENGLADSKDEYRRWWIEETIVAMERAMSEGVQLKGYFHWSLLDNFEWDCGWWPKFGLVSVDREHEMKRTVRPSAWWFAERLKRLKEDD